MRSSRSALVTTAIAVAVLGSERELGGGAREGAEP